MPERFPINVTGLSAHTHTSDKERETLYEEDRCFQNIQIA